MTTSTSWLRKAEALAKFCASAIGAVSAGQTRAEVRAIMGRDPWRHERFDDDDVVIERWGYMTDVLGYRMVWITFRDGIVSDVRESGWDLP